MYLSTRITTVGRIRCYRLVSLLHYASSRAPAHSQHRKQEGHCWKQLRNSIFTIHYTVASFVQKAYVWREKDVSTRFVYLEDCRAKPKGTTNKVCRAKQTIGGNSLTNRLADFKEQPVSKCDAATQRPFRSKSN